ncbi:MAG: ATP-binding protein [Actinobacteria bacterium]|nr:ATP-binding protein [Actinomycetota bacterium]
MERFPDASVCVSVPAGAALLTVVRSLVLGAGADLPLDLIEDVALAVDEAASAFVESGAERLDIGLDATAGDLTVVVGADVRPDPWPPSGWPDTLAGRVIGALVDGVAHRSDAVGGTVTMTRRVAA